VSVKLTAPCVWLVRGEQISSSVPEHTAGCHVLTSRTLNICVMRGGMCLNTLPGFGN